VSAMIPFDEIQFFVAQECAVPIEKMSPETRLFHDLGVDGSDAEELLAAFEKHFHVDMQELNFHKHFGEEAAFNPVVYLYWLLFARDQLKKVPVTLEHLHHCAAKGRWIEPGDPPC